MATENALQSRILKSFDHYRQSSSSASMKALGKRLVGELLGETEYVAATVTLPGSMIAAGVAARQLQAR
ncbi:MAG: hypothetical protein QOF31_719 [Mycobacterium sp.]|jgi:hypothetical protein|nr:hypothetical protein [Mycobacterium sp.]